jgi:hypothetical protein
MRHFTSEILKCIKKDEKTEFIRFLESPYFNTNKNVVKLFKLLLNFNNDFELTDVQNEKIFKNIYGNKNFNHYELDNLFSKLLHAAENFFKQKGFESSNILENACLFDELSSRNALKLLERTIKEAEKKHISYRNSTEDYFINKFRLETAKYNYLALQGKIKGKKEINYEIDCVNKATKYQIINFILSVIKGHIIALNYSESFNLDIKDNLIYRFIIQPDFKKILNNCIRDKEYSEYKFILEIYYNLYMIYFSKNKTNHYKKFKTFIEIHRQKINNDELTFLYGRLVDFCVEKNTVEYREELFGIHIVMLENGYYETQAGKYITVDLWRNILINCKRLHKIDRLEMLVKKNKNKLHPSYRQNMEFFSLAEINFEKKQFEKSLINIEKVDKDYYFLRLDINNLKLKLFYELNYDDSCKDLIDNYKHTLRDKNIPAGRKKLHKNFITSVMKLIKLREKPNFDALVLLQKDIENNRSVNKDWLLEKLDLQIKQYSGVI